MKIDGVTITSEEQILAALQEEFDQHVEFVIMENGDDYFIQTSGGALEYNDGDKHCFVKDHPVDQEKIKAAFISYYRGDGEYLRNFEWTEYTCGNLWSKIKKLFGFMQ